MRKKATVALMAILLGVSLVAAAGRPANRPSKWGFLYAVPQPECPSQGDPCQFETRLLVIDGENMRVALTTPHLYIPRSTGFWEVGIIVPKSVSKPKPDQQKEESDEGTQQPDADNLLDWQLWAAPIAQKPALPEHSAKEEASPPEETEQGDELRRVSLSWVGTDYVSVTEQRGEYTSSPTILSIDGVVRSADLPWTPTVPDVVLKKDLDSCVDEKSDFNTSSFLETADQSWSIVRGRMRWEFAWSFSHSGRALRGYEAACTTSLSPPKELVGNGALSVGWNQVLLKVPDARTAFSSPDGSLVLVFTSTQVLALRREGDSLGEPFARVFVPQGQIVSGQWAVGKYVDAWTDQLSHAKSWIGDNFFGKH
jgi:hypothetical protein